MEDPRAGGMERPISRLLLAGTFIAIGIIAIGVVLMAVNGRSPLDAAPALDIGRLPADLARLQPAAFLWLGLLVMLATPSARVIASLIGYLRAGERGMALVAVAILTVIAIGVITGATE